MSDETRPNSAESGLRDTKADYVLDGSPEAVAIVRKARGLPQLTESSSPGVRRARIVSKSHGLAAAAIREKYRAEYDAMQRAFLSDLESAAPTRPTSHGGRDD